MNIPNRWLWPAITLLSVIVSLIIYSHNQPINRDGLLYLTTAQNFLTQGFSAIAQDPSRGLYAIMIAGFSQLTSLTLLHSAFVINTLLLIAITVFFTAVVRELGGDTLTLIIAALVISLQPTLTDYRADIIRIFGFLAGYFAAILALLRFSQQPNWRYAISWNAAIGFALLFRKEAFIFLALIPFVIFVLNNHSWRQRLHQFLRLNALPYTAALLLGIAALGQHFKTGDSSLLSTLQAKIQTNWGSFHGNYQAHIQNYTQTVLNHFARPYKNTMMISAFIGLLITVLVEATNPLLLAASGLSTRRKILHWPKTSVLVIAGFISVNLIVLSVFLAEEMFLSHRYVLALSLTLLLPLPFGLRYALKNLNKKSAVGLAAVSLMLVSSLFHFGTSKAFIVTAGKWINTNLPHHSGIITNEPRLDIYSQRDSIDVATACLSKQLAQRNYRYAAVVVTHRQSDTPIQGKIIKSFKNKKNDQIFIVDYQLA